MTTTGYSGPRHSLWGKQHLDLDVYEASLERVRHAYSHFDEVFVSFSGGKDSTIVLHAALDVATELGRLPLRVVFIDEEAITPETVDYCRRVAQRDDVAFEWYCLPVKHRNACSVDEPVWWPWAPEARERWVRPLPPEAITALAGFTVEPPEARLTIPDAFPLLCPDRTRKYAALLGIRADESITRRRAVSNRRPDNFVIPTQQPWYFKVYPVYDWKTSDVWTAPARFGWDYNRSYDLMEMHGISHAAQRCAPPFGDEPIQGLAMWAACWPDTWDRMLYRVAGAATAARYSRTELYSYNDRVEKPADMSWQDFIRQRIDAYPDPDTRRFIAWRLREMLQRHFRKTSDPILGTARHPLSGLSWEYLYTIADRGGDPKKRKQISEAPNQQKQVKYARTYDAALAEYRARGGKE